MFLFALAVQIWDARKHAREVRRARRQGGVR